MKPTVHVLVVADDPDGGFQPWTSKAQDHAFHLGEFVKVLKDTVWLGFKVELVLAHQDPPNGGETPAQAMARTGADVVSFRFDQDFQAKGKSWTLTDFDMILFLPQRYPGATPLAQEQAEAAAIAAFMEQGGGVFATGDHDELGSAIPQWVPRVRNMRRWLTGANPPAPFGGGADRVDTTRPGPDNQYQFEDQSDEIAQPIAVTWWGNGWIGKYPHPLLCSPAGAVEVLPDHMHEGICDVPDDLGQSFQLQGTAHREYPDLDGARLSPVMVATGEVIGGHTMTSFDGFHNQSDPTNPLTFGVICAWDGHRVDRGRVVVDSTWHHFFNINLTGDKNLEGNVQLGPNDQRLFGFYVPDGMGGRKPAPDYEMIQWYYRNIVYWLIPADRYAPIWWSTLADIAASAPRLKEELAPELARRLRKGGGLDFTDPTAFRQWLYFGQLAEWYLKQARGACTVLHIKDKLYKPKIPWWEWVQEEIDPWGPLRAPRVELEKLRELQRLGLAPRFDAMLTAGLGAAMALAVVARRETGGDFSEKTVLALDQSWETALTSLGRAFQARLAEGLELGQVLARSMDRGATAV